MRDRIEAFLLHHEVEQFLAHEAELLDGRRFDAWLGLLASDVRYWMPVAENRAFDEWDLEYTREGEELNWFDEGKFELEQRVRQIQTGVHWAEEPASRTSHLVTNVQVREVEDALVEARCRFLVYRNRTEGETDLFVGKRTDLLRRRAGSFEIVRRTVWLDQSVLRAKNLTTFF